MWPNREKRRAWTIADRRGCPVVCLTLSFHTCWYHLIPNSFHKHHWSRASVLSTSLLVTAQHSEPHRKMDRMQVLIRLQLCGNADTWLPNLTVYILHSRTSYGIVTWDNRTALSCWVNKGAKTDTFFNDSNLLPLNWDCWWFILPAAESEQTAESIERHKCRGQQTTL